MRGIRDAKTDIQTNLIQNLKIRKNQRFNEDKCYENTQAGCCKVWGRVKSAFYRIGYKCPIFSGLLDNFVTFIETGVIAINHTTVVYYDHLNAPISPSITGLWNSLKNLRSLRNSFQIETRPNFVYFCLKGSVSS